MPEHEAPIKTIAAPPKKRKSREAEEQEALSIMPATETPMPQTQGSTAAGNSDKAKAYLVDYLAKNSKSEAPIKQPVDAGKYKTGTIAGPEAPAADKEQSVPEAKPQKFLNPAKTDKVVAQKLKKAGHLAKATATTKSAAAKIAESEQAQDKPEAEQHSDSNEGQVTGYAAQPVADKTKEQSQKALRSAIADVIPKTLGDIRDFKEEGKAKHISNAVSTQVSGDVGSVKQSFGGIGKTPPPAPAEKGKELPAPEEATPVEQLNMGAGVIPEIEPQHLDTKDYLKQNDELLKKEELPQEHLDMVDTGDLAQANKERNQLKADAVAEPQAVKEAAAAEHKQLNTEMHAEEKQARSHMNQHRSGRLKETGEKQKATKTRLEKERETVAKTINDKYEACQKSIIGKLDKLEKDSLARFDKGQAKATVDFEDQVNRDIAEFKRKRYDEVGWAKRKYRQARDWLLGIDDFPEVSKAFDDARKVFESTIDRLIGDITADNNKVIADCKKELADCKADIARFVKGLKGSLKDAGNAAMKEVGEKLKALDAEIDKRKEKMQQQLADKRAAAMKAIDQKIEKMKEKLSGALSIIGKLLLEALKKFFKWALEKLGIDAEGFFNTLSKMGAAIKAMFKSPGKFFGNLIDAVKGSIDDFRANFKTYIIGALADWLTGAMGSTGIQIPKEFSVRAVIGMLLQVLGLSWAFLRGKLVALIGEEKVAWAEKTVDVVKKFVTGGIAALWDWIVDQATSIKDMFIQGTKDWLLTTLVTKFVEWIASLLIPGGAILRLVQGIYNLVMWFVNNIQKILRWVNAVLDSLGNVAMGAISAAIGFIVNGMKIIIPVILDFFARLLNISGIVDAVKNIINKIATPIHAAINKVIDWVVGWVKKMFGKGKEEKKPETKEAVAKMDDTEVGKVVHFNDGEEDHEIWIAVKGDNVEVMVASSKPKPVKQRIIEWRQKEKLDELSAEEQQKALELLSKAEGLNKGALEHAGWSKRSLEKAEKEKTEIAIKDAKEKDEKVEKDEEELKGIMLQLFRLFKSYPLDEEGKRLVGILDNMTGVTGAKGFAGTLKGSKIPAFREGLKTQAKRAVYYFDGKLLISIEYKIDGSRVDLVIGNKEGIEVHDIENQIYVEVKNWTGWDKWDAITKEARLNSLVNQIEKYKAANSNVLIEWKGDIPKEIERLRTRYKIEIKSI